MIEIGIFDTGSSDLPTKVTASGLRVVDTSNSLRSMQPHGRLTIAQTQRAVLAGHLGYDVFWIGEHHFSLDGSELSPNPLQTQTAWRYRA
jgi:hypothetical protein